ncbi:hypothetical protein MNBD_DELTA01-966 [hydrothermal vent metagenome]|uniref:SCP2 domain-containing protein n=1 Tax=hydrothermal vent metagenome TaxID=652676 RepID=A0A3B0QTX7_9ZZZZ
MDFDDLSKEISGELTDGFLHVLLESMSFCFDAPLIGDVFKDIKEFRRNIDGFEGRYLFVSEDGAICEAATFKKNKMKVKKDIDLEDRKINNWDIIVRFKNARALRNYLFSEDQDILNLILTNDVEVEGNLNYLFKFGFISKDLLRKTGLDKLQLN